MFTLGRLICLQIVMLLEKSNFYKPLLISLIPSKQTRSVELISLEKKNDYKVFRSMSFTLFPVCSRYICKTNSQYNFTRILDTALIF